MSERMKVAVYTRVSTDKEEQKTSLQFQREKYQKYCEDMGYSLFHMYADKGLTGTNNKRKAFLEMMEDAGLSYTLKKGKGIDFDSTDKKPLFDLIIVKDVSRFARNINASHVVELLHEKDVFVLFENNNLSTKDTTKSEWKMRLNLDLTFAEKESLDKSEKIKWTRDHKAKQGKYHFARIPFGYYFNKKTNSYEIKEDEAEAVKHMFHMYVNEDKGCRLIRDWLQGRNIINRTAKNNNPLWNEATINRMLKNEVYTGTVILGKFENNLSGTRRKKMKKESEWVRLENAIPAIIDKEIFEKANEIRKQRTTRTNENSLKGKRLSDDIFANKIKCGKCGGNFTRIAAVKKDKEGNQRLETSYMCYNRRKYRKCDIRGISYNVLEREILREMKKLSKIIKNDNYTKELEYYKELTNKFDEQESRAEAEISRINMEIKEIEKEREKVMGVFIDANEDMKALLNKKVSDLKKKIERLESEKLKFDLHIINRKRSIVEDEYKIIKEIGDREYHTLESILPLITSIQKNEGREFEVHLYKKSLFTIQSAEIGLIGDWSKYPPNYFEKNFTVSISETINY